MDADPPNAADLGNAAPGGNAAPAGAAQPVHEVRFDEDSPVSEFEHNDLIMCGGLPWLFFSGRGVGFHGSAPKPFARHVLRQADRRFDDKTFSFLLFNQVQRHAAISSVAGRVKSDPASILRFKELVMNDSFRSRVQEAVDNPTSPDAEAIMREVTPLLKSCGASVPFSQGERSSSITKLISMVHLHGLPSWFITVSPPDQDNILTFRMANGTPGHANDGTEVFLRVEAQPDLTARMRAVANNPAAAAEMFKTLVEVVMKHLVGLDLTGNIKKTQPANSRRGVFGGKPTAHMGVVEAQGRGTLHIHFCVWGCGLPPDFLEQIADNERLATLAGRAIDTAVQGFLPEWLHEERETEQHEAEQRKADGLPKPPRRRHGTLTPCPIPQHTPGPTAGTGSPDARRTEYRRASPPRQPHSPERTELTDEADPTCRTHNAPEPLSHDRWQRTVKPTRAQADADPFIPRWARCAGDANIHKHCFTCRKGKNGAIGCRMCCPKEVRTRPTGPSHIRYANDHEPEDDDGDGHPVMDQSRQADGPRPKPEEIKDEPIPPFPGHRHDLDNGVEQNLPESWVPFKPRDSRILVWELHRPLPQVTFINPQLSRPENLDRVSSSLVQRRLVPSSVFTRQRRCHLTHMLACHLLTNPGRQCRGLQSRHRGDHRR